MNATSYATDDVQPVPEAIGVVDRVEATKRITWDGWDIVGRLLIHVVNIFYNSSRMACKNVSISTSVPTLTRSESATIGGVRKYRTKMRRFSSFS